MNAPQGFVQWLSNNQHKAKSGHYLRYHSRSNSHSNALARLIWDDLVRKCPALARDAQLGVVTHETNFEYTWPGSGKAKTIDLAVGPPSATSGLAEVWISCELKSAMTEHKKAEPRLFDELQSSYRIVNAGNPETIAAGLVTINIATRFASPLRQTPGQPLVYTQHNQPHATESMVRHLRGLLPLRQGPGGQGFDAFCQIVIDCDNVGPAMLWTAPPAPQPGEDDHYDTFLQRICDAYTVRFHGRLSTAAS